LKNLNYLFSKLESKQNTSELANQFSFINMILPWGEYPSFDSNIKEAVGNMMPSINFYIGI
jgi:hypothetical protein